MIIGQEAAVYRKERGKKFRNTISAELGLGVDFNFFEFDFKENVFQMTPYIHTGIIFSGIMLFITQMD